MPGAPDKPPTGRVMIPRLRAHLAALRRRGAPPPGAAPPAQPARHDAGHAATAPPSVPTQAEKDPLITEPFADDFDRSTLGGDWRSTGGHWTLRAGRLCADGARNRGVWLKRRLPDQARIEFDAFAGSNEGGVRADVWGDGHSADTGGSYTRGTGYLVIFGGWADTRDVLARLDEGAAGHAEIHITRGGAELRADPVARGARYHFEIERMDKTTLHWFVNDIEILSFIDPKPLAGAGHDHFGFNNWNAPVCFDNLKITPLGGS